MSANGWLQFVVYSVVLGLTVKPVGIYLACVLEGKRTWLDPVLRPVERLTYKICGVKAEREMHWREYTFALLGFSAVTMVLTYIIERCQAVLRGIRNICRTLAQTWRGIRRRASPPIQIGSFTAARAR